MIISLLTFWREIWPRHIPKGFYALRDIKLLDQLSAILFWTWINTIKEKSDYNQLVLEWKSNLNIMQQWSLKIRQEKETNTMTIYGNNTLIKALQMEKINHAIVC